MPERLPPPVPNRKLPAVVALADRLARKAAIGQSGSYCEPDDIQEWVDFLQLTPDQLRQVQDELPLSVSRQCEQIQWTPENGGGAYVTAVQNTAAGLARDNRLLTERSRQCEALSGQNELIQSLLDDISEYSSPVEIAERFAAFWQKQYACGTVAVAVIGDASDSPDTQVEIAVIARDGRSNVITVRPPAESTRNP